MDRHEHHRQHERPEQDVDKRLQHQPAQVECGEQRQDESQPAGGE